MSSFDELRNAVYDHRDNLRALVELEKLEGVDVEDSVLRIHGGDWIYSVSAEDVRTILTKQHIYTKACVAHSEAALKVACQEFIHA